MRSPRGLYERWRRALEDVRPAVPTLIVPMAVGVASGVATHFLAKHAVASDLSLGLATLITVNAVVVGLVYATMQRAVTLTNRTPEGESFALGVVAMTVFSMFGVFAGVIYLVWSPGWPGLLPFTAACLVGAPVLLPVLAVQEQRARHAGALQALKTLEIVEDEEDSDADKPSDGNIGKLSIRSPEFVAEPSAPFAHDVLGREPQVKAFCSILAGIKAPAILSIDAGWGAGKTAFVKMSVAWMRSSEFKFRGIAVAEFNAWMQNHTGDALQDVVASVTSQISDSDSENRRRIAELLEWEAASFHSDGLLGDEILTARLRQRRNVERFKTALRSYVKTGGGRLVVFVDELDRCRPEYAMSVLERIRHLFDVEGVIVVLSVNKAALDHAVSAVHGPQDLVERYLRRFVDQTVWLTQPDSAARTRYVQHLCNVTGLNERLQQDSYTPPMLNLLAEMSGSSLRDLEQTVHRVVVVLASIPRPSDNLLDTSNPMWAWEQTAMTLMVLREAAQGAYEAFVTGHFDAFHAGQALREALDEEQIAVEPHVMQQMELLLLLAKRGGQAPVFNEEYWDQYVHAGWSIDNVARLQQQLSQYLNTIRGQEPEIEYLAGFIEMTDFDPVAKRGSQFTADAGPGQRSSIRQSGGELSGTAHQRVNSDRMTVIVEPENPRSNVTIDPPDADPDVPGHQVALPDGEDTTITVTTTTPAGTESVFQYIAQRSS
ncbi:MAG: hypothetical protein F4Z00_12360 [Acidimicrobiaceae bacterium]|nr:hypothetical protein [Acidimicrobiaceae bacterium]MXZ66321.1 hypothetical protein [Acidimicrobiaceae bacterium]MYF32322.1 hypothetical protein [Acidimicrobiaceae bacterium]MYG77518.1 hypothetical protein [Acidimicrobiaceae bacterium]